MNYVISRLNLKGQFKVGTLQHAEGPTLNTNIEIIDFKIGK